MKFIDKKKDFDSGIFTLGVGGLVETEKTMFILRIRLLAYGLLQANDLRCFG